MHLPFSSVSIQGSWSPVASTMPSFSATVIEAFHVGRAVGKSWLGNSERLLRKWPMVNTHSL